MLNALNIVRGAVATKDLLPVLKSIHSYNGRLQGCNGRVTIDAPCVELEGKEFTVGCVPFLKAVDACSGEPELVFEPQRITVKRGTFKAVLPLEEHAEFPRQEPTGQEGVKLTGALLPALRTLQPFVSDDASRPWACGILFRGGYAFATNNIVVAGLPAVEFPMSLNLPGFLIDELLRLGLEPLRIQATSDAITFHLPGGAWIKGQLLSADWPAVENMMPAVPETLIPTGLQQAVERLLPFCPDPKVPLIFFSPEGVRTNDGAKSATVGGFDLPEGVYRAEPLLAVLAAATAADFTPYPAPATFAGAGGLKGLLVGVTL